MIQYFIGFIVFILTILGYSLFVKNKLKIDNVISLVITFAILPVIMFFSGLLNIMCLSSYAIYFIGTVIFFYYLIKQRNIIKKFIFDKNIKFIFLLLILVTVLYSNMHPMHYDNFSHWANIVQSLFNRNALPNFEVDIVEFKSYQPGTACFIYLVGIIMGKTEGVMIVAQNYIFIIFICSILALLKEKFKIILKLLLLFCIIYMSIGNIYFYDLLVDTILAVVSIASFVIFYKYTNNTKKLFWLVLPLSIYLVIIKNSGILFVALNCIYLLISAIKYNKKDWKYCIILGLVSLFIIYLWGQHVSYAFGDSGLLAPHSMSIQNFMRTLTEKGMSGIIAFVEVYFSHFLDIFNNFNQIIMIVINLILISMLLVLKKYKKVILFVLLLSDTFYLSYYFMLGIMYLLSMNLEGSLALAGFDRYLYTGTFIVIGMVVALIFRLSTFDIHKNIIYSYSLLLGILFVILTFGYCKINPKVFLGDQDYDSTYLYKLDTLKEGIPYGYSNDDIFYLYTAGYVDSGGLYTYASRYKFNHRYTIVVSNVDEIDNFGVFTDITTIIALDVDNNLEKYISANNYIEVANNIYQKNMKGDDING